MHTLASELANEATPVFVRNAAGLALKNALTARVRSALFLLPLRLLTHPLPHFLHTVSRPFSPPTYSYSGPYRRVRAKQNIQTDGSLSMPRSATRSRSLSFVAFTLSMSRREPSLRRASQLSQPWSSLTPSGQI